MPYYRKIPGRYEARQFTPDADITELAKWCGGTIKDDFIVIPTLEGPLLASPGDYIVRGIVGEFWAVRADIFEKTYEQIETPTGGINA